MKPINRSFLAAGIVLGLAVPALAAPSITEYAAHARWITAGPDANLWFTDPDNSKIGKITTFGVITEYGVGTVGSTRPDVITAGPDGNMWFTDIGNDIV